MALKPSNDDPNRDQQLKEYSKDNRRWGGDDLKKQEPPPDSKKKDKE